MRTVGSHQNQSHSQPAIDVVSVLLILSVAHTQRQGFSTIDLFIDLRANNIAILTAQNVVSTRSSSY
jgi:hypothetical protein